MKDQKTDKAWAISLMILGVLSLIIGVVSIVVSIAGFAIPHLIRILIAAVQIAAGTILMITTAVRFKK